VTAEFQIEPRPNAYFRYCRLAPQLGDTTPVGRDDPQPDIRGRPRGRSPHARLDPEMVESRCVVNLALCILILTLSSTSLILNKSRMRKRARTDLIGGSKQGMKNTGFHSGRRPRACGKAAVTALLTKWQGRRGRHPPLLTIRPKQWMFGRLNFACNLAVNPSLWRSSSRADGSPTTLANYRKSFRPSEAKNGPSDAALLLDVLTLHRDKPRALTPDTRTLQFLVEERRKLVDEKTRCSNRIAPVGASSGRKHWVHWRSSCPKFLRQTFQE
jgi:hypothetical protein